MKETVDERTTGETATEAALEEAESRFHTVFDVNPAPALIIHLVDERIELLNSGFTDLTGYSRREVQGLSLREVGGPQDRARLCQSLGLSRTDVRDSDVCRHHRAKAGRRTL